MSMIKNQRCFTEATASARLILATGLNSWENLHYALGIECVNKYFMYIALFCKIK